MAASKFAACMLLMRRRRGDTGTYEMRLYVGPWHATYSGGQAQPLRHRRGTEAVPGSAEVTRMSPRRASAEQHRWKPLSEQEAVQMRMASHSALVCLPVGAQKIADPEFRM